MGQGVEVRVRDRARVRVRVRVKVGVRVRGGVGVGLGLKGEGARGTNQRTRIGRHAHVEYKLAQQVLERDLEVRRGGVGHRIRKASDWAARAGDPFLVRVALAGISLPR